MCLVEIPELFVLIGFVHRHALDVQREPQLASDEAFLLADLAHDQRLAGDVALLLQEAEREKTTVPVLDIEAAAVVAVHLANVQRLAEAVAVDRRAQGGDIFFSADLPDVDRWLGFVAGMKVIQRYHLLHFQAPFDFASERRIRCGRRRR